MARRDAARATRDPVPLQWPLVGRWEEIELFESTLDDPRAHGFVMHGHAGVGKTRLGDECLAVAHRRGRTVARASAGEGTQSAPLGALAHLLPPGIADVRFDLVAVLDAVAPELRIQGEHGPLVLFVDDLHRLDATSAVLLAQLVDADLVFLVATVRSGEPIPPSVAALWQRARVRRVDLPELDQAGVDTLLHLVLRGPVAPGTIETLWAASRGNVLFVRELVLGALATGGLIEQHGVWQMTGPLVTTAPLLELVEARFGELDAKSRDALDVLAVWEPTSLAMVETVVDARLLEDLDRSGLLSIRIDGRRQQLGLAHPLYGEILRGRMSALTRRRLLIDHADEIEQRGARRREDPIRIATARVDAAAPADPELLIEGARLARWGHDFPQVERLARAALLGAATPEAGFMLGEALHELGAYEEAEEVLGAALDVVSPEDALFKLVAEMRALNLMWGLHRHQDALVVNRAAQARCADPIEAAELALWEATLLAYSGRPVDALAVLDAQGDPANARARVMRAVAEVATLIAMGRPETAADLARAAFAEHSQMPPQMAAADAGLHVIMQIYALIESGAMRDAFALAHAAYDSLPPNAPPGGPMWLTHLLGRSSLLMGDVVTARRWLGEAVARCEAHAMIGPRRLALSLLATAHALLGDAATAAAAVADLDRAPELAFARAEQEVGRAWALVAAADVPGARQVLLDAAAMAAATGYRITEASLLHDVARLGDAAAVADRIEELAAECEGSLIQAYAAHARARTGVRPEPLLAAADRFDEIGAALLAAEAATEAAQAFQRQGDQRAAWAAHGQAARFLQACEGARTPALATTTSLVPLSAREREIATFAARGETAKDIAARLFLSMRTVNNHLQNVYTKLGISGRGELAQALGETAALSPDDPARPPSSSRP
jgi:DNA-binding CsgD family transcriptional regulator